ncbi:unnamed protein product [Rhizophagus irregularis]|uniref:SET domain-containing protein n=1 Tax=Rhizophagus irregularis TaxID=588596 RepID=A0A915Z6E3_9GLOM|nr:unnamed protein product [Rhizophagus irregularis]CAB5364552.1 unnamed protein product [Rhizophagus irregularis]
MERQTVHRAIGELETLQSAILRLKVDNFSQRKSKDQFIREHKNLDNLCDKNKYVVHNIKKQKNLTLNIQLRISISNLRVNINVPNRRFLLCRVISRFIKIDALLALVEDPEGNVERLALYNWTKIPEEGQSNTKSIDESFLPIGTLLVIKNISYKFATGNIPIIRSDNPDDVIIVDHNNTLFNDIKWSTSTNEKDIEIKNVDDFRRRGNDYFASNNYISAIDEYTEGIELESRNVTLLSNRAEAYLRLGQFYNALEDAKFALTLDPNNIKAAYRKGKALCGLKYYKEASNTLQILNKRIKGNNTLIKQITEHAEMLFYENKNGKYDYLRIIDEFYERAKVKKDSKGNDVWIYEDGPRLDHADFLNENIKIDLIEGKGRGWIAKCDIPELTLLMVSKPLKLVFSNEAHGTMISDESNDEIPTGAYSCSEELAICIAHKLFAEPHYCREVYQLYTGLNININEKIEKINKRLVNIVIILHAIKYNSFGLGYEEFNLETELTGAGLWILPSFFNHACIDENVNHFFLGDLMFFRTNRPISKGEELIVNYRDASFSYKERSRYLKAVSIDCQCRMCKLERSESQEIKLRMAKLLTTYNESIEPKLKSRKVYPSLIKQLEDTIAELRNLRKEHPDLGFNTIVLSKTLAHTYRKNGNKEKALSILKETYDLYKAVRPKDIRHIILNIIYLSLELKLIEEAKKWFDILLKNIVEPIMGKLKDDKPEWRKEALLLAEKILPEVAKISNNVRSEQ